MPSRIFLDTSGWIAALNAREVLHASATAIWWDLGRAGCRVVLTDWIIMSDHGVTDAFTTDRHFEQAGFNCLLPVSAVV
jgi:predicted nucleic acid-binding protein